MAHSQQADSSLYMEIHNLREALDASMKKIDRYAHLIATLSDELDNLRCKICYACKNKLVPGSVSVTAVAVTAPSGGLGSSNSTARHHMFQGRQPRSRSPVDDRAAISPSNLPTISTPIPTLVSQSTSPSVSIPSGPAAIPNLSTAEPTHTTIATNLPATVSGSTEQTRIPPKPKSKSEWSVVYNPKAKKSLKFTLDRVVTYEGKVYCARFSPDGKRLAVGFWHNGKTYIYDIATGKNTHLLVDRYNGIEKNVAIRVLQFSPNAQLIVTASDYHIRVWDIAQKRLRAMFKGYRHDIYTIAFSPDSRFLVSDTDDRSVRIWNMRDGSSRNLSEGINRFTCVTFSPDGKYIAAGNSDHFLRIWNARTNKLVEVWLAHADQVRGVVFTADGKGLVSASDRKFADWEDRTLKYWDVSSLGINQPQSGRQIVGGTAGQRFPEVMKFDAQDRWIRSIAFAPDNRWLFFCSFTNSVRVWDFRTAVWQCRLEAHIPVVQTVAFTSAGNYLASGDDHQVTIWNYEHL